MQVESTTITTTAACDLGRCGSCRGVVLSLTSGHLTDCQHECHNQDQAEEVDLVLDEDELEAIAEAEADRRLDQVLTDELFGAAL
jgi:hypothetical protein